MIKAGVVLWVALGGAIGSSLRYIFSMLLQEQSSSGFPYGTLTVNLIGCFLIGILVGFSIHKPGFISENAKFFLATGLCGGFTTFSAFSAETFALLDKGDLLTAGIYVGVSIVAGLLLTGAGIILVR